MAVQASAVIGVDGVRALRHGLMPTLHVALLAQSRHFRREHLVIGRAMRIMASEAVFLDRRMFPEHRRLLLAMTFEALVIEGFCVNQLFTFGAVRIVAR